MRSSAGNKFSGSGDSSRKWKAPLLIFHVERERLSGTKYPRILGHPRMWPVYQPTRGW